MRKPEIPDTPPMPHRLVRLARAERAVMRVLEGGNTGINTVGDNPEKAQFVAPTGGFCTFRFVAEPLGLRRNRRG